MLKNLRYRVLLQNFHAAVEEADEELPFDDDYWVAAAMFISSLIQKKMQKQPSNKGLTVLIFDDNKIYMPKVSDLLYTAPEWFDGLYQQTKTKSGEKLGYPSSPQTVLIVSSIPPSRSDRSILH